MFYIYPYMTGSKSVKKLKELLEAKIIKLEGSKYRPKFDDIVINYGNSRVPDWVENAFNIINEPEAVRVAASKLATFRELEENGVPTVPYTTVRSTAQAWLNEGSKVFVRNKDNGHSGDGIEVVVPNGTLTPANLFEEEVGDILSELSESEEAVGNRGLIDSLVGVFNELRTPRTVENTVQLPEAPLYTRGISNKGEYRVHVVDGEVILYQKKSRRVDDNGEVITAEGAEADVRNLASNWVYRTGNLKRLDRVEELAVEAIEALGLDFGAVDIIMDENGDVFVLEVNTAPGIGNTETQEAYKNAFLKLAGIDTDEDEMDLEEVLLELEDYEDDLWDDFWHN
jgi:hypothetical protein